MTPRKAPPAGDNAPPSARLDRLQSMRGVAVLMVVLFHAVSNYVPDTSALHTRGAYNLLAGGVDVFFVISGFIIHFTTEGRYGPSSVVDFAKKRLARIVPLYWLVTALVVALSIAAPSALRTYVFEPRHALASFAFIPWPRPDGGIFPPLVPGWSLNFEMMFYAAYAMLMLLVRRELALIALTGMFCLGYTIVGCFGLDPQLYIFGHGAVFEFLVGVAFADIWRERHGNFPRWAGPVCLAAAGPLLWLSHQSTAAAMASQICGFGLLTVGGLLSPMPGFAKGGARVLGALGDASYSIYLTHPLVLGVIALMFKRLGGGEMLGGFEMVVMLVGGVAAGLLCHRSVERPLLSMARRALAIGRGSARRATSFSTQSPTK